MVSKYGTKNKGEDEVYSSNWTKLTAPDEKQLLKNAINNNKFKLIAMDNSIQGESDFWLFMTLQQ